MPTYDYACWHCDTRFEAHHPLTIAKPSCPVCGGETHRLILSAPAVHGRMAKGRDEAVRSLETAQHHHGKDCPCCH
jgi:putative FmdB family regulatory protein